MPVPCPPSSSSPLSRSAVAESEDENTSARTPSRPIPIKAIMNVSPRRPSINSSPRTPTSRRLSITATGSPSSPPLLGSYTSSLLTGRMSSAPSPPLPFTLLVSVLGFSPCPPSLKCPARIERDFEARWYELHGPWVGSVDLDEVGGYRVPPKGQVQLVVKNQLGTVAKVLLVPYDLSDMPQGSRALMRRMWYGGVGEKEVVRYAVNLQFVCEPERKRKRADRGPPLDGDRDLSAQPPPPAAKQKKEKDLRKIFLAKTVRLVFASRTPDGEETVRVVTEGPGFGSAKYEQWEGWDHSLRDRPSPVRLND